MNHRMVLVLAVALVAPVLAGCVSVSDTLGQQAINLPSGEYDTSRGWSMPLSPPLYKIKETVKELVPSFDGTPISLGIFLPDVPEGTRIPVVMDAGPYYADHVHMDKFRPPIVEWLVPRGYAVVQMSIRGTGESGGCMELMSEKEQKDVDAMVTWLAGEPWSNGNVGMMGRSYDGTTPLMAAALGNPHLKTIVPISGVTSVKDLMFKNGTSEFRGPIFHNVVYWTWYGLGTDDGGAFAHRADHWGEQACEEVVIGTTDPGYTTLTGDASSAYFTERDFRARIVENYKGSIWIVHGLEDWNVNPSMVVPWINELQDAGIETRAWLGVWGHAYPDRVDEHRNVRWDWAEETVKWFDHYLKGVGPKPPLDVEVEDSLFVWRSEASYPPRDAFFREFELSAGGKLAEPGSASAGTFVLGGNPATALAIGGLGAIGPAGDVVSFTTEPLETNLRLAGLTQLHLTATPTTPTGSHLFAELYDVYPDGRTMRIGWGAINLRFAEGGNTKMTTLTPGQPVLAKMEFEPMDAHVGQGHRLRLVVHKMGVEDILPSPFTEATGLELGGGKSLLRLQAVDRPAIIPTYTPAGLPEA